MRIYPSLILLIPLLFESCIKDNEGDQPGPEIIISGEIYDESDKDGMTKAPLISNTSNLPTSTLNINFARTNDGPTANWATVTGAQTSPVNNAGGTLTATLSTTGAVTFASAQYYNGNPANNSYFVGYYPASNSGFPSATNVGTLQWTIDGKTDIMHTALVSGNKTSGTLPITFTHKLCWIKFYIQASSTTTSVINATKSAWGNISAVTILNQNTKYTLTLPSTGVFGGTLGSIKAWTAADGTPAATAITSPSAPAFVGQAMVQPMPYVSNIYNSQPGNYAISFKAAKPNKTYTIPVSITGNQSSLAGNIHSIYITFPTTVNL